MAVNGTPAGTSPADAALEKKHKLSDIRASWAQVAAALVSAAAVMVAIFVAVQGQITVNHNSQVTLRQSEDSQLSTAITALGSSDTAEQIAGLVLLAQNAANRFTLSSETGEPPAGVFADYTTALQILSGYLSSNGEAFLDDTSTGQASAIFGRGYGVPPPPGVPINVIDAADQVEFMLGSGLEGMVTALNAGRPAIDLSYDELIGQPWYGINFDWISAYLVGIDLRGANLASSRWSGYSDLSHSYLQCADLEGADFRGAYLTYADLRGANVQGADFRDAHIKDAILTSLYGDAEWPSGTRSIKTQAVADWNQGTCLRNRTFWDNQSASPSTPTSAPSPSSSPAPGSSSPAPGSSSPAPGSSSPTPEPSGSKGK